MDATQQHTVLAADQGSTANTSKQAKPSRYNFVFDSEDGDHLAFNALSGALVTLDEVSLLLFQKLVDSPSDIDRSDPRQVAMFDSCYRAGLIVEESVNELDVVRLRSNLGRFSTEHFMLTILPTMNCNFACAYCYETSETGSMRKEMQEALAKWVDYKTKVARTFTVDWFGGEPLLALDCVRSLSERFIGSSEANGTNYNATIVTNGYLLTRRVVDILDDLKIGGVQVTVDGPPHVHNRLRKLRSGGGTYDVILANLEYLIETKPNIQVNLRVNCAPNTIDLIPEFIRQLPEGIRSNANIYAAQIFHASGFVGTDGKKLCVPEGSLSDEDAASMRRRVIDISVLGAQCKNRFDPIRPNANLVLGPRAGYCEADFANRFVIDPHGRVLKCTVSLTRDAAVGKINLDGTASFDLPKLAFWLGKNPFTDSHCTSCKLLPICMGGCHASSAAKPYSQQCQALVTEEELTRTLAKMYSKVLAPSQRKADHNLSCGVLGND